LFSLTQKTPYKPFSPYFSLPVNIWSMFLGILNSIQSAAKIRAQKHPGRSGYK
jgi:hypothetical protein